MGKEGSVVPVFDLQEFPLQYNKLREACEELGYFRVVNHGVPVSLMSEMKKVARSLLDLPIEAKNKNKAVRPGCGYIPCGRLNPVVESLCISELTSSEAIREFCSVLNASPRHREVIEMYSREVSALAIAVGGKVAQSLGLLGGSDLFPGWTCRMRIHKYSFSPETVGNSGIPLHTDKSLVTILQDDDVVGGFEVLDKSGSFIAVKPSPDSFLVNVGDFAVAWSNGRFCSVKHHVQCTEGRVRVSIATFMMMPYGVSIKSPEELIDSQNPRLYVPFSFEDYITASNKTNTKTELLSQFRVLNLEN